MMCPRVHFERGEERRNGIRAGGSRRPASQPWCRVALSTAVAACLGMTGCGGAASGGAHRRTTATSEGAPLSPNVAADRASHALSGVPREFPIYPGAVFVESNTVGTGAKKALRVVFSSADDVARVDAFYSPSRLAGVNVNGGAKTPESPLWTSIPTARADVRLALGPAPDGGTQLELLITSW